MEGPLIVMFNVTWKRSALS